MVGLSITSLISDGKLYEASQVVKSNSIRTLRKDGPVAAIHYITESLEEFHAVTDTSIHMVLAKQILLMNKYLTSEQDYEIFAKSLETLLLKVSVIEWNKDWDKVVYNILYLMENKHERVVESFRLFLFRLFRTSKDLLQARRHLIYTSDEKEICDFLIEYVYAHCEPEEAGILIVQVFLQFCGQLRIEKLQTLLLLYTSHFENGKQSPPFANCMFNFLFFIMKSIKENKIDEFLTLYSSYRPILLYYDERFSKEFHEVYKKIFPNNQRPFPVDDTLQPPRFFESIANALFSNRRNEVTNANNNIDVD